MNDSVKSTLFSDIEYTESDIFENIKITIAARYTGERNVSINIHLANVGLYSNFVNL